RSRRSRSRRMPGTKTAAARSTRVSRSTSPSRSSRPRSRASSPTSAARRRASAGWRPRGDGRYRVYIFSDELVEVLDGAADRMVGRPREALAVRLGARIERRADVHGHRQARSGENPRPEMRDEPAVVRPVRATVAVADRHRDDRDAEAVEQSEEPRVKGPRQPPGTGAGIPSARTAGSGQSDARTDQCRGKARACDGEAPHTGAEAR